MTDLTNTILAKSDQLNSDDLIGRSITIEITKVSAASAEQPIAINYVGDNGKPYYPCKSMRRVLVHCWGADGASYVGRSLTLYRDPDVKFGGIAVGGIRISHMSHIDKPITMSLTNAKASKKPFTVKPMGEAPKHPAKATPEQQREAAQKKADEIIAAIESSADVDAILSKESKALDRLADAYSDIHSTVMLAAQNRRSALSVVADEELPL